jgi:hypothetical protein
MLVVSNTLVADLSAAGVGGSMDGCTVFTLFFFLNASFPRGKSMANLILSIDRYTRYILGMYRP